MKLENSTYKMIFISEIDPFPNHPYQVRMDEEMDDLIASVAENGVITPLLVRPKPDGRYELISGHRRKRACEYLMLPVVKCQVMNLNDYEAIYKMIDSNIARNKILPSEKAFAYKMQREALNAQEKENYIQNVPPGFLTKKNGLSFEKAMNLSEKTSSIRRYIRLTFLIPELLEYVDKEKLSIRAGVELSYLDNQSQERVARVMAMYNVFPTEVQARHLNVMGKKGSLRYEQIEDLLLLEQKRNRAAGNVSLNIIFKQIPEDIPADEYQAYIIKCIRHYKKHQYDKYKKKKAYDKAYYAKKRKKK